MSTWDYVWAIGAGFLVAVFWLRDRHRSAAIRALAARYGFVYLGNALPRPLTLSGTPLADTTSIYNAFDGERHGIRIVAFDCQMGIGKARWRRTVIAAETPSDVFCAAKFNRNVTTDRSGNWIILFQPKTFSLRPSGRMSVAELEAHLNAI